MQRIFNFSDWQTLKPDVRWTLGGEESQPRVIRLEVNAEDKCKLYVEEDGVENFLALVEGRDEIQFSTEGVCHLSVSGGLVNIKTAELADWSVEAVDDTTFTTIVERRMRNPELELMMHLQQQNMEKRLAAQQAEFDRRLEARFAASNVGTTGGTVNNPPPISAPSSATDGGTTGNPSGTAIGSGTSDGSAPPAPSTAGSGSDAPAAK